MMLEKYENDLIGFENEYEIIKSSGLDIIEIENKLLAINDKINERDNIIQSATIIKQEIEKELIEHERQTEEILKALSVKESINELNKQFDSIKERLNEIEKLKTERSEYLTTLNRDKLELTKIKEYISRLTTKIEQLKFNRDTYNNLVTDHKALQLLFEDADVIRDSLNASKGIPLIFLQVYLKNCPIMMNNLLDTIYNGELQIEGFLIDENEFRIPFNKSGIKVPDISFGKSRRI